MHTGHTVHYIQNVQKVKTFPTIPHSSRSDHPFSPQRILRPTAAVHPCLTVHCVKNVQKVKTFPSIPHSLSSDHPLSRHEFCGLRPLCTPGNTVHYSNLAAVHPCHTVHCVQNMQKVETFPMIPHSLRSDHPLGRYEFCAPLPHCALC